MAGFSNATDVSLYPHPISIGIYHNNHLFFLGYITALQIAYGDLTPPLFLTLATHLRYFFHFTLVPYLAFVNGISLPPRPSAKYLGGLASLVALSPVDREPTANYMFPINSQFSRHNYN